jgi:hypothetical protein
LNPIEPIASLLYISVAAPEVDEAECALLLDAARARNASLGISGAMLAYASYFVQVLEGEPRIVQTLFDRIGRDARHHDVRVVSFDAAPRRMFDGWAMRQAAHPLAGDRAVLAFLQQLWADPTPARRHTTIALLQRLSVPATATT